MASQALMKHQAPPPHAAAGAAAAAAPEADEGPESESAPGIKRRAGIACRRQVFLVFLSSLAPYVYVGGFGAKPGQSLTGL